MDGLQVSKASEALTIAGQASGWPNSAIIFAGQLDSTQETKLRMHWQVVGLSVDAPAQSPYAVWQVAMHPRPFGALEPLGEVFPPDDGAGATHVIWSEPEQTPFMLSWPLTVKQAP